MLRSKIKGVLVGLFVILFYIISDSYFSLYFLVATIFLLLFLGISIRRIKKGVMFSIRGPKVTEKNTNSLCSLETINTTVLPIAKMKCLLFVENVWTGEEKHQELYFSVNGKNKEKIHWNLNSKYCGKLNIRIQNVICYDYLGIFKTSIQPNTSFEMLVLPNQFDENFSFFEHTMRKSNVDVSTLAQKGQDSSDIFSIKEYKPGDEIKHIHWKLTSKFDEIIVKEMSETTDQSILLLLETSTLMKEKKFSPKVLDSMMEAFISVSKSLIESSYTHFIGWYDNKMREWIIKEITSIDDLSYVVHDLLQIEKGAHTESGLSLYLKREWNMLYSHLIYITPEQEMQWKKYLDHTSQITILQCLDEQIKKYHSRLVEQIIISPEYSEEGLHRLG
ncbi:DUF58 domain-containing protein [Massilibacterium senegalense]|uniref:DUF58 domain-containing protein n=1 Tax=Massilibacterium senegalense TaxID=1632858 RepID=UPI000782C673|nr:DUF58 domain-containing protein [Massilibacterium senegalense]